MALAKSTTLPGLSILEDDGWPNTITVTGRHKDKENQDLQGEYHRMGEHHGRPAWRKPGTKTCIRYWPASDRWLIDREGLQESDVCNAFAERGGVKHPAMEELVWRIWETARGEHVRDPEFLVTSAPATVQVVGRAPGKENCAMNGEYKLIGLHQGRVAYQKVGGKAKHAIRYWQLGDRWLIDLEGLRDMDVCNAFADAQNRRSPVESANPEAQGLTWQIWDTARGKHVVDPCVHVIAAPAVVELVGRDPLKENASMNGSYHLVTFHAGRPAYMKADGSGHALRYWPQEDRWLVDLDGLRDADVCNAYAEAKREFYHPGNLRMVWHIWETSRGRHLSDPAVHTFVAPHWVRIDGRDQHKENATINGTYELVNVVNGKAAYKKPGSEHVIRFWPSEERWIIDLEAGFLGGDIANAFADSKGSDHPGNQELLWYVWETSQGRHVVDEEVMAEAMWLPEPEWSKVPGFTKPGFLEDAEGAHGGS